MVHQATALLSMNPAMIDPRDDFADHAGSMSAMGIFHQLPSFPRAPSACSPNLLLSWF
jgi:proteasome lid subunit RPN8/RPN11